MLIKTEGLTKIYQNGFKAVNDLNLNVCQGDIFGFLGPNGAGKTTTIRMLDGLLTPTSGTVEINGMDIKTNTDKIKSLIGVVPESHGYYFWMTAEEYLKYFQALYNISSEHDEYISDLLRKVGLFEKKNVPIFQYSRGMKQRLGIAKSLINKPRIIFLDEPTLGLDPQGQREIRQLLLDINRNDNITIFITSHLLKDIEVLCNKVCIVKNGIMIEQGTIKELQNKYLKHCTLYINTSDNEKAFLSICDISEISAIGFCDDRRIEIKLISGLDDSEIHEIKQEIMSQLYHSGLSVDEMSVKALSMEDIFFHVTESDEHE